MKIAYITSHFPCGPGERFFEPEVNMLAELGQQLVIIPTRPRKGTSAHTGMELPVLRFAPFSVSTLLLAALEAAKRPGQIWKVVRHIVACRYSTKAKCKNLLLIPKALRVARALRRERVDHVHAQWLSTPSTVAYVASMLTGIPWSCTAHQFDIFEDNLIPQKISSARFVRVISTRNREHVLSKAGVVHASRCKVVHLGVIVPQNVCGPSPERPLRILCAANLVKKKGHEYLISALGVLQERGIPFECDLAGDGPLRAAITSQIARLGLTSNVRLRGLVAHDRLCAELCNGRYDLFVLASTEDHREFEGIPVALMEAMAAGVPCISTRTGSIAELIPDSACSRLVAQRDIARLADAIEEFAVCPEIRVDVGRRARERVVTAFDTRSTTKQLFELISMPVANI